MTVSKQPGLKKSPPKNRLAAISPARKAAFDILSAVEHGQLHSDDLLRSKTVDALSSPDRNLATALVLGVLRWQIQLDQQFQALLARPDARLDLGVRIALRLGAFQILHMDRIPARAAIDESVELAKQAGNRFASGMVNAVLRKLAAAPRVELGASLAHPAWLVERWTNFYGLDATQVICRHGQSQPGLTVRLANPEAESELIHAGIALEAGELLAAARTVLAGDLPDLPEGRIRLQDEGSQLVAELACENLDEKKSILDTCAAPGGKTLILAERNPQARIVACESSGPRHKELQKRLAFLGSQVECRRADAAALAENAQFDLVLADVPCSGTGTLGRNPEIRHRLRLEDLMRQAERQRAILQTALRAVRIGGHVVYSTCSLEPEENEQVIASVLAATPNARVVSLEGSIGGLQRKQILTAEGAARLHQSLTADGFLRLLPGVFHTDGFFIASIERTS
jgi:16S rRNA (cytosine967-C5)-methyltransferase